MPSVDTATLQTGDIQLGAVEIKDGSTDQRAVVTTGGAVRTLPPVVAAADVVVGALTHTATTAAATLITVAAGKTWRGVVTVNATCSKAAAATGNGQAVGTIASAGTGVVPTAATVFAVAASAGANAATGASGSQGSTTGSVPLILIAPVGNAVTLTLASTVANATDGSVNATASGEYVN